MSRAISVQIYIFLGGMNILSMLQKTPHKTRIHHSLASEERWARHQCHRAFQRRRTRNNTTPRLSLAGGGGGLFNVWNNFLIKWHTDFMCKSSSGEEDYGLEVHEKRIVLGPQGQVTFAPHLQLFQGHLQLPTIQSREDSRSDILKGISFHGSQNKIPISFQGS